MARQPKITKAKAEVPITAKEKEPSETLQSGDSILGKACPLCGKGIVIKGKTAYGCSEWKNGCSWRLPFKS